MEIKGIEFESMHKNEDTKTTTMYFTAPTELLSITGKEYPEAVMSTISIESSGIVFPEADGSVVSISPTKEDEDGLHDYDWTDINIDKSEIEYLINMALVNHYGIEPIDAPNA